MSNQHPIAKAIFEALETKGWIHLTLHDVAEKADISLEELHKCATSKEDLMAVMISYLEEQTLIHVDQSGEGTAEDHLFEGLFARFEAADPYKKAIARLWQDFKGSPTLVRPFIPQFLDALKTMGKEGGLEFEGPLGAIQLRAFGFIYLRLLYVWLADESPDLAKTMSETNRVVTKYIPCLFNPCKILDV